MARTKKTVREGRRFVGHKEKRWEEDGTDDSPPPQGYRKETKEDVVLPSRHEGLKRNKEVSENSEFRQQQFWPFMKQLRYM